MEFGLNFLKLKLKKMNIPVNFFETKHGILTNKLPGYSLIMFVSKNCIFCTNFMNKFVQLSQELQGCNFKIMEVNQNDHLIRKMAANTSTPINFVPYIILYQHGVPLGHFLPNNSNPEINYQNLKKFLIEKTTNSTKTTQNKTFTDIKPEYSLGIPFNKNQHNVCYLNYESAYN